MSLLRTVRLHNEYIDGIGMTAIPTTLQHLASSVDELSSQICSLGLRI